MHDDEVLVFDTGPLGHFARQNWLGVLKAVVGGRAAVIPDVVVAELEVGAAVDSRLRAVLEASWIERRELSSERELHAFGQFASRLVKGARHRGEAGVLALASTVHTGVAVIDDGAGRRAAEDHGVTLRPTLALLCEAIRGDLLTVALVSALADDLLEGAYRLPFGPGGFERWARDHGPLG